MLPNSGAVPEDHRRGRGRPRSTRDLEDLYRDPPDALVVTGTEPLMNELTDERYWEALATLLHWAETTVPSTLLSCLAAHGALRALDQTDRVRLSVKRSGVYPQAVNQSHPFGRGLGAVAAFPHSRWNTVPGEVVRSLGYDVVVGTTAGGVDGGRPRARGSPARAGAGASGIRTHHAPAGVSSGCATVGRGGRCPAPPEFPTTMWTGKVRRCSGRGALRPSA